ncbi:MAG: sugar transferase [Deltaproteobacteria bacterium]|nr:sugar transferase [Deltaproteobacteria bacterium]
MMPAFKIKEIIDQIFSWLLLFALSPIFWFIAALIRLDSSGPAFYRHTRVGKGGHPFVAYKFRSMVDKASTLGLGLNVSVDDPRITRIGNLLRNSSMDELPQLFNVLKGDMSLVGPRPSWPYHAAAYNDFQRRRLEVKPGITGWAQINGRNSISWEERIALDVWYIDNWSLKLDFYILLRTIKTVVRKEGLYGTEGVNYDLKI